MPRLPPRARGADRDGSEASKPATVSVNVGADDPLQVGDTEQEVAVRPKAHGREAAVSDSPAECVDADAEPRRCLTCRDQPRFGRGCHHRQVSAEGGGIVGCLS